MPAPYEDRPDVVLIGAGIMSASLAALLRALDPTLKLSIFESLNACAEESSDAWNNAGTGHAAYCELNYTPQDANGRVKITQALDVNAKFDLSQQLWAYLSDAGWISAPDSFIRRCPHMSFVHGQENVDFLRARHQAMSQHYRFETMAYTEDHATIAQWAPLLMQDRLRNTPVAATREEEGTDVDFGALTRILFSRLSEEPGVGLHYQQKITELYRDSDGRWRVTSKDTRTGQKQSVSAGFVFVGAGGAALQLLERASLPEARGYAGFPVSGLFLYTSNPELCSQHNAKVYGKASVGAPPMSVPHLDRRSINGQPHLLFGPFAGFSSKFLKSGRWSDLPRSVSLSNVKPMFDVLTDNRALVRYLVKEVLQSRSARLKALQTFYATAKSEDWKLAKAGQRVQIIKRENGRGTLKFGTEVFTSLDKSLAAVLGASPGASIAASVALQVVEQCFADRMPDWREQLHRVFPSLQSYARNDASACREIRAHAARSLKL